VEKDLALIEQFLDALWLEKIWPRIRSAPTGAISPCWWSGWRTGTVAGERAKRRPAGARRTYGGGYKATSSARLLSAMRRLFQHLYREKIREDDPSALLASPKLPQRLPKDLSEAQVERLLQSPLLTCRWSYAIKPCLSYCMLPACAFLNWLG
jgi:integrase/recombinase XerD